MHHGGRTRGGPNDIELTPIGMESNSSRRVPSTLGLHTFTACYRFPITGYRSINDYRAAVSSISFTHLPNVTAPRRHEEDHPLRVLFGCPRHWPRGAAKP